MFKNIKNWHFLTPRLPSDSQNQPKTIFLMIFTKNSKSRKIERRLVHSKALDALSAEKASKITDSMALKKIQMWCRSVVGQDRSGTDWLRRRIITCKDDYGTGGALRVTIIVAQEDCGAWSLRHMIIAHEDHSVWRSFSVTIIAPEDDGAKVRSREIGRRLSHSMRNCITKISSPLTRSKTIKNSLFLKIFKIVKSRIFE